MFDFNEQTPGFELGETATPGACIKVVGVGGAGGNAVQRMIEAGVQGVEFIAMNTDAQALNRNPAPERLQLGQQLTKGLGSGANPEVARQAALESEQAIAEALKGADMVFIAAGMGKGTGTGAAPVVAEIARKMGILTVPVVTRPFTNEGPMNAKRAEAGLKSLREVCDSVLVIPNDRIITVGPHNPLKNGFKAVDDTLRFSVQAISDVVTLGGLINVDFNDVRKVMGGQKGIFLGCGAAEGEDAALRAARQAMENPYLESPFNGNAGGLLVAVSAKDESFTSAEYDTILGVVRSMGAEDADMISGLAYCPEQAEDVRVTVIATGFENAPARAQAQPQAAAAAAAPAALDELPMLDRLPARAPEPLRRPRTEAAAEDDLDTPAFLRRLRQAAAAA